MGKIRKNARRKRFNYEKNRKRMNKDKTPPVANKILKENWTHHWSTKRNMQVLGLAFNLNEVYANKAEKPATEVVMALEKEAKAPREKGYRIPKNQVDFLTEMLDKYGEDYKKMALDKKNYGQLTWKQFRRKINEFKAIPEQYCTFLEHRKGKEVLTGFLKTPLDDNDEW